MIDDAKSSWQCIISSSPVWLLWWFLKNASEKDLSSLAFIFIWSVPYLYIWSLPYIHLNGPIYSFNYHIGCHIFIWSVPCIHLIITIYSFERAHIFTWSALVSISGWSLEKVGGRGFPEISTDLSSRPSMFPDLVSTHVMIWYDMIPSMFPDLVTHQQFNTCNLVM